MAIAVSSVETGGNTSSSNQLITAAAAHVAGDALILFTILGAAGTLTAGDISNTAGDTWVALTGTFVDDVGGNRTLGWYVPSTNGHASDQVTINISTSVIYRAYILFNVSGQLTPASFDSAAADRSLGGSSSPSSGSITVSVANALICAVGINSLGRTFTAGSGFTAGGFAITGDANTYYYWEHKAVSTSTAADGTLSSGGGPWTMSGASFKESTGGDVTLTASAGTYTITGSAATLALGGGDVSPAGGFSIFGGDRILT